MRRRRRRRRMRRRRRRRRGRRIRNNLWNIVVYASYILSSTRQLFSGLKRQPICRKLFHSQYNQA